MKGMAFSEGGLTAFFRKPSMPPIGAVVGFQFRLDIRERVRVQVKNRGRGTVRVRVVL